MRESSSSDDINVRKERLILKHRDTVWPRNYGSVVIILYTPTFLSSAPNANVYKELICHQLGKELLASDLFVFHLGFNFISWSNPVSSQPLLVKRKQCPIIFVCFSPMLLLCHKNIQIESSPSFTFSNSV